MALEPRSATLYFTFLCLSYKADFCAIDFLIYSWLSGRSLVGFADAACYLLAVQMSGCNNKKSIAAAEDGERKNAEMRPADGFFCRGAV